MISSHNAVSELESTDNASEIPKATALLIELKKSRRLQLMKRWPHFVCALIYSGIAAVDCFWNPVPDRNQAALFLGFAGLMIAIAVIEAVIERQKRSESLVIGLLAELVAQSNLQRRIADLPHDERGGEHTQPRIPSRL